MISISNIYDKDILNKRCGSMKTHLLLPLLDYQRIYQVIYSVLRAAEVAKPHRACILFSIAGMLILRNHYRLPATISAGVMGIMVDENTSSVALSGRMGDRPESNREAFHFWVECEGWLIDFMAPIMGVALKEDGHALHVPRRMLQQPLAAQKTSVNELHGMGDFYLQCNSLLAGDLLDTQSAGSIDLAKVCLTWFRRPPSRLEEMFLGSTHAGPKKLVLRAPSTEGVW
ncbi:MAG: DUF2026 family protein [Herminiimonas sp.]|nr:DUF2026 family protein [Herminiimonas sp.]